MINLMVPLYHHVVCTNNGFQNLQGKIMHQIVAFIALNEEILPQNKNISLFIK